MIESPGNGNTGGRLDTGIPHLKRLPTCIGSCADTADFKRSLKELAELVGGIAGDYHTLLATVLADAEPAVGEFPAGTRPTKTVRESRCCTSHHTRVYDQVGQDYFDVLG